MRRLVLSFCLALACAAMPARAQVSVSIGIGIQVPAFPRLVIVPGYPVYYAPGLQANFFFYDGLYWVLEGEHWYMSAWFNGPWQIVVPERVPYFLLRVPVRYYRAPPPYFRGWRPDAPPRWGEHWGPDWQRQRPGWNHWDRRVVPPPAPLPGYQRRFDGERYPRAERQRELHTHEYRYQPRSQQAREHYREHYRPPKR